MELTLTAIVTLGIFIQAVVEVVKKIWKPETKQFSIYEIISICAGILVGIIGEVNLLEGLFTPSNPVSLYALYAVSGVCLGRGGSILHDLWTRIRTFDLTKANENAKLAEQIADIFKNLFGIEEEPVVAEENEEDDVPEKTE
jgi:hypothetical protein